MKPNLSICLIITLLCINSFNSDMVEESREFLNGLMKSTLGKDYSLGENCLGKDFVKDVSKLINATKKENSITAYYLFKDILAKIEKNCPQNEVTKMVKDTESFVKSGNMLAQAASHSRDLMHDLHLLIDEHSPKKLGGILGEIINMMVYNQDTQKTSLTFLSSDLADIAVRIYQISTDDVKKLVDGLFEGISEVPYAENRCKNDVAGFDNEIVEVFTDLINAFRSRDNIIDAIEKTVDLITKLQPLDDNCRFTQLATSLVSLSTKVGIARLVYNLTYNYKGSWEAMKGIYDSYETNDWRTGGVMAGKLLKLGLNYSTK